MRAKPAVSSNFWIGVAFAAPVSAIFWACAWLLVANL